MSRRVERFEDLIAWQKAMDLVVDVYTLTRQMPFSRDFALVDQSHRAAISVASNIAEGFDRGSRAEFHRFLSIAKGSCAELCTQLHLAHRLGYIDEDLAERVLMQAEEVSRIIGGLRAKVATQRDTSRR
jgi:four helix bundle protein